MKLTKLITALLFLVPVFSGNANAQRNIQTLEKGWKFFKSEASGAEESDYNDSKWENVTVPHDWAIFGPFDRNNDLQNVAITQNFETQASVKTGRTGGLPYVGVGWYRTTFNVDNDKQTTLVFDGAMSEARVYVNGQEACFWPLGYNSFHCDVTSLINKDGKNNILAVRLENRPQSSRWYPGAGLYRNVHVITTEKIHVPVWGTQITTPHVGKDYASVNLRTEIKNADKKKLTVITRIYSPEGKVVAIKNNQGFINHGQPFTQNFVVNNPLLWSPEEPNLYKAVSEIYADGTLQDTYSTTFGIRTIEYIADKGFFLNGKHRKFQGVCNHHDLGPLGAAVNVSALRHQLKLLKDMGCDAIRTAHNMPAPELVKLCDEMGFMMMIEPFDEWDIAKCDNGYHRFFNEWAEKDMVNMLRQYRNNACVVMWSIGNEVPTQCSPEGYKVAKFLQDICHREDPTRPVTCGMDQVSCVLNNGFAAMLDIPGFNYRAHRYEEAYERLPQNIVLGSETSSTVSSRGVYKFPVESKADAKYDDHQSSSYDLEYCSWSNIPDIDFALAEDHEWTIGQFVWTGFDYLGEPSPYDTDAWPNHSSMFGIIDLASIPKDRYYLYRSVWNKDVETLHILPHWNWEGYEGKDIPVFVYTNYPSAELFVNGVSQGIRTKNDSTVVNRYRLMWHNVKYQPGELKVIAYNSDGSKAAEKSIHTAGKPYRIKLVSDYTSLKADGKDLAYVTLRIEDKGGNLCPTDGRLVNLRVDGAGKYRASANGDPTCLDLFHKPEMHAFNGMLTVILQAGEKPGKIRLRASAKGLKTGEFEIPVTEYSTEKEDYEPFYKGADISWVTEMESQGHKFYNKKGEKKECTSLMKELGLNAIRLRVWVNPKEGWSSKEDMLKLARRAKANGMELMVDFHYSDWWADPGQQHKPAAWKNLSFNKLKTAMADHTKEVLEALKAEGITPKWIQVGNEIRPGMLWDENPKTSGASYDIRECDVKESGSKSTAVKFRMNWKNLAELINSGYDAVKSVFPGSTVIVHLDNGYDKELYRWFFDELKANGGKWDMIGMSIYPYWTMMEKPEYTPEKTINDCIENIRLVNERYNCDVMIVETGMECADDNGNLANKETLNKGYKLLRLLITKCIESTDGICKGVFYWEPECKPNKYRLGAFTEDGKPTEIMDAFMP